MNYLSRSLILGCSVLALAACGPDEISSPGGGDIIINPGNGGGGGDDDDDDNGDGVQPADGCPTLGGADELSDNGTITGPTGTYRVCGFPQTFTEDASVPYVAGVVYSMPGRVDIGIDDGPTADASDGITGTNVTLTIDPGVVVYGATGRSYLVANRGSKLVAEGTAERPIIFTSRNNVVGLNTNTSSSQWGGVVLLGRAAVSDCSSGTPNPANQIDCQQNLEGAAVPPAFGGDTGDDSSGSLKYVQIRFSGFALAPNNELQSLTLGGVGSGTGISYIQTYNSSDDGVEMFGGEPKLDHFIVVGAEDDSFDIDTGAKADIQYAIAVQRPGAGDNLLELDSEDSDYSFNALPRTFAQFSNFTFIVQSSTSQALRVRGRADLHMVNGVIIAEGANCLRIDEEDDAAAGSRGDEMGPPRFDSVLLQCNAAGGTQAATYFADGENNQLGYTPTLTNLIVNGATEENATTFDATAMSSYFTDPQPAFVGAVSSGDLWHEGWTCNSQTINLNGGGSCLSLPVYN